MKPAPRAIPASILLACMAFGLAGCGTPGKLAFWRKSVPAPEVAHEIVADPGPGAMALSLPQTWQRNAVRVDVSALASSGTLKILPAAGHSWPIRLEFLARPGNFTRLQVVGDQRVLFSIPADGDAAVLKVPVGVYSSTTRQLVLTWNSGA